VIYEILSSFIWIKWYDYVSNQDLISQTGSSSIWGHHLMPSPGSLSLWTLGSAR